MPPVPRLAEERDSQEWIERVGARGRRASVDQFPLALEETGEALQRLADVNRDVLSLAGSRSPERGDRDALGREPDGGHGAEPDRARDDRVPTVEAELAAAVGSRHADVLQHLIDAMMEVELRRRFRMAQFGLQGFGQQIGRGRVSQQRSCVSHFSISFGDECRFAIVAGLPRRTMKTRRLGYLAGGISTYAMPVRFPSATSNVFLLEPSRFALYTVPAKSVMNIRPPLRSSARPIPSIRWVKTISGALRFPAVASIGARLTVLPRGGSPRSVQ